ncbi:MAG: hypothetical protein LBJ02_05005 [Bifidobacteriaceae bacterium]|jgi:hypothetical protein|nr:hypothetical protein [Bifidobacteriaceae bacterium]
MTIDDRDRVRLVSEMPSDWPLLEGSAFPVESLSAVVRSEPGVARDEDAELGGMALAEALGERAAQYRTWLLIADQGGYDTGSRIAMYWFRKRRLLDQLADLSAVGELDADFEFTIAEDAGRRVMKGVGLEIKPWQWGPALRTMPHFPAVGVSFRSAPATDWLIELGTRALASHDDGGWSRSGSRGVDLRRLLIDDQGFCGNVLTVWGDFDDYTTDAEYYHPLPPGEASLFEDLTGVDHDPPEERWQLWR